MHVRVVHIPIDPSGNRALMSGSWFFPVFPAEAMLNLNCLRNTHKTHSQPIRASFDEMPRPASALRSSPLTFRVSINTPQLTT